ncbi:hypothetical protein VNO78_14271 [Psophocarpus tetragonolobus]|uniref:Transmembrane protein n=1 Tax=Psophocarpus tetragonolobus TaxID=3891 RepID=A0AAN9XPZ7_PSOTE
MAMAVAVACASLSPRITIAPFLSLTRSASNSKRFIPFHSPILQHKTVPLPRPILPPPPAAEDVISSAETASEQLYKTTDQGVATVVSSLFFIAFIALSAITLGVIYLAVTDFLQKSEKDKFEKEEASKVKSKKKNNKLGGPRAGPRGFGQKVSQDPDDD